jgi:protein phosphatase
MQANKNAGTTHFEVVAKTDVGLIRSNNEDSFGVDPDVGVLVLCDGMGGANAGEVASGIGVTTVLEYFREAARVGAFPTFASDSGDLSPNAKALEDAMHCANRRIRESAASDPRRHGMGSTMVAAVVYEGAMAIANVGDSRIYRIRNQQIEQLTQDHSLVMEHVRRGLLTQEEANKSQLQNIITRALGAEEELLPDIEDLALSGGDRFLLCSDGLTRNLGDDEILSIVQQAVSLDEACDRLIGAANDAGGEDNVTCVLAAF